MNTKKLKPSNIGGYPFEGIKSLEVFPNRIQTDIKDGRVIAEINADHFPQWFNIKQDENYHDNVIGFWMDRVHDYHRALNIAENQLRDQRAEFPFQPEDFLFTEAQTGEGDKKATYYSKGEWALVRSYGTNWMLSKASSDQYAHINLPNAQIAFITLRAMGVVSDEDFDKPVEVKLATLSEEDEVPEGMKPEEWEEVKRQRRLATGEAGKEAAND